MLFNLNIETASRLIGSDSLGSPTHTVVAQQHAYERYTPFGFSTHHACSGVGFAGQFLEASAEQYLLGNGYRGYMPGLMLFGTPDSDSPFGPGGINAYVYCASEPINLVDPTGHMALKGLARLFAGNADEASAALASRSVPRASSAVRQRPAPAHISTRTLAAVQDGGRRSGPNLPARQIREKVITLPSNSSLGGANPKPPKNPLPDPQMYVQEWLNRSPLHKISYDKNPDILAIKRDNRRINTLKIHLNSMRPRNSNKRSAFRLHYLH